MPRRRRWHFTMGPLEHVSILWLDDVWRGRFTTGGRVLILGALAGATVVSSGLLPQVIMLFGFCLAALFLAGMVSMLFRPSLTMRRRMGAFPAVGDVVHYLVEVRNDGRRTARSIVVEERGLPADVRPVGEPPMLETLEPGETVLVPMKLQCNRRGAWQLHGLQGGSMYPLGLIKNGPVEKTADRLLVYPRFSPLQGFEVPHGRSYQPGGIAVASSVGDSTEFLGLRDWRDGDRLRDVHWASYARTGRLTVREFQEEYFVRLALVIDVEVKAWKDEAILERALSATAAIADALARKEYIIDVVTAGTQVFHFQAGRALAHLDNILEVLAGVEDQDRLDVTVVEQALIPQAEQFSAVILVFMDWDEARSQLVQNLKSHGMAVRVLAMRPGKIPTGLAPDELVVLQ